MQHKLKRPVDSVWLAEQLGREHRGETVSIRSVVGLDNLRAGALSFVKSEDFMPADPVGAGAMLILPDSLDYAGSCIPSPEPRNDFVMALAMIEREVGFEHPCRQAEIAPSVVRGQNVVIEDCVVIGAGTRIEHNVVIHANTRIGENCYIRSGAVIGTDGFGYERDKDGTPIKFVHLGGVEVGNEVEIGANACIAKGVLGDTRIEDAVKIDNLVHIAHNCHIKRGAFVIASASVSGSVTIGEEAWVAPGSAILQGSRIGAGAQVGIGAVVLGDVEAEAVVAGNPARNFRPRKEVP